MLKSQFPLTHINSHMHLNVAHLYPAGSEEESRRGFTPLCFEPALGTLYQLKTTCSPGWHELRCPPSIRTVTRFPQNTSISCDSNSQGNSRPPIPPDFTAVLHNAMELRLDQRHCCGFPRNTTDNSSLWSGRQSTS